MLSTTADVEAPGGARGGAAGTDNTLSNGISNTNDEGTALAAGASTKYYVSFTGTKLYAASYG